MEAFFKQYYWVIKALGLAVAVGLAASALVTHVGTTLALETAVDEADGETDASADEPSDADRVRTPRKPSYRGVSIDRAKAKIATDISERNIFCPTCVPVVAIGDPSDEGIRPGEVRSNLPLRLMATMEAIPIEASFVTIFDSDRAVTGLYGLGDQVRVNVEVVGIEATRVHLRNNVQLEYVELGGDFSSRPKPTIRPKDTKKKKSAPNKNAIPGADDAIRCANENSCTVERAFVEKLMSNPAMLAKQARIIPSMKNGETEGFKFYGIRRGSLPKLLGLKNGDMLTEVNGEEIRSVDQAMGLAVKLRRASNLSVTLVRKGKPMTKEIQIQ